MNKTQFTFWYDFVINDAKKVECDKITHGKDFNKLTPNQKMQLYIICSGEAIDFVKDDQNENTIFGNDTETYELLGHMDEERWETYLEIMASRGITVTYDNVEDIFIIS